MSSQSATSYIEIRELKKRVADLEELTKELTRSSIALIKVMQQDEHTKKLLSEFLLDK